MKIKCINPKSYKLTFGKEYEVIEGGKANCYLIKNDEDNMCNYGASMFIIVAEEEPIQEADVDPEIEVKIMDESVEIWLLKGNEEEHLVDFAMARVAGNCGVLGLDGVNSLYCRIKNKHPDSNNHEEFFEKVIEEIVNTFEIAKVCAAIVFSTNDTYQNAIWPILSKFSAYETLPIYNPNSGNDIKTWVIVLGIDDEQDEE